MIDEKYRRNPENITDFLKKERFRYIKIFERLVNDKLYEEYEQCDFVLEKIEEFTEEDEKYLVYRIKEEENKYNVEYLKERILENFIFDELYFLVNQKFELLEILNIDEIMEKIEIIQQEVIKIENVDLKLKYPDLEKYKKLVSDEDVFLEFIKNYKFYSVFKSNISDKKKTIYGIGSKPVPLSLQTKQEKGVYVIKGHLNYDKMSNLRFHKFINSEYRREFENVKVEYGKLMLLDDVKITRKVDNMIKIYEKENEYGLKNENSRNRIIYFKREFLKYLI
ncbi:hypothetical protein JMUB4039_0132 [Leptotrichia trevisanii]|uniref:hypothetical protein n=1 Tax=Leptotrichia trevisanii TaxID=109328 RepID=UPI0011892C80|nr:hypothetical protein [Leptotrichia trevisanii]BBM56182.1 hypothetical protein JMUB4039_0132 [Leptotrichia trevisanii]